MCQDSTDAGQDGSKLLCMCGSGGNQSASSCIVCLGVVVSLHCHVLVVVSRVEAISQPLAVLCILCVQGWWSAVPRVGGGE